MLLRCPRAFNAGQLRRLPLSDTPLHSLYSFPDGFPKFRSSDNEYGTVGSKIMNHELKCEAPLFNLPTPKLLCRVVRIHLKAEPETDEVYAQITLLPEPDVQLYEI
ncbi:hypothetical protein J5N97_004483 [Dioscorea zingiberensis]|uniref:Uncharacterized protein n=1 Tax=Dioscorea zingiberensis TaxID=325984 RepID=A0A9D5D842_9LILI|nr:hypothetical protein J5N97_004483 [Dioscorea zingiberensis]